MDAILRRRALLLIAATAALAASCGGPSPAPVGVSDRTARSGGTAPEADAGVASGAHALPAGYRSTFTKLNRERVVSQGHAGGRWEIDVYANDLAKSAIEARAREVPAGAVVVQEHYERSEGNPAGPVMVMEKVAKGTAPDRADWRYVVIGARGNLVSDGAAPTCQGCHDEAPMDGLFPIVE
jgi:hypothetical protein